MHYFYFDKVGKKQKHDTWMNTESHNDHHKFHTTRFLVRTRVFTNIFCAFDSHINKYIYHSRETFATGSLLVCLLNLLFFIIHSLIIFLGIIYI